MTTNAWVDIFEGGGGGPGGGSKAEKDSRVLRKLTISKESKFFFVCCLLKPNWRWEMWFKCCWTFSSYIQKVERLTKFFFFLLLVLLVEYIFLTTCYGLYFNHQLHVTVNNFFKFLHVSWRPPVGSFHVLHLHLSFWLVGTTKMDVAPFKFKSNQLLIFI